MRESDFIAASNLARVRVALHCVGQLTVTCERERVARDDVVRALYELEAGWQERLEARVERRKPPTAGP